MQVLTDIPDLTALHLSGFQSLKRSSINVFEVIDFSGLHIYNRSNSFAALQPAMENIAAGTTRHAHYQIAYHLVWIPKYRRKVLVSEVEAECKRLIAECCEKHRIKILALETDIDHVHLLVSAPPRRSPAWIVNLVKGYTSRFLRERFPKLKKTCGKERLWTSAYYVGTAGTVSTETIRRYINECQGK